MNKDWKLINGELFFKSYRDVLHGNSLTGHYFITEEYFINLDEKIDCILSLGCAVRSYNPKGNLAEELIRLDLPKEYEKIMIKRFKEMLKEKLNNKKKEINKLKEKIKEIG